MGINGSIEDTGRVVDEIIYVRFVFSNYGFKQGEVVAARANMRDAGGVHVALYSREHGASVNAWSDLGSFRELTAMEVLALATAGLLPEEGSV